MSTLKVREIPTPDGSPVAFPNGIRVGSNLGAGLVNNIGVPGRAFLASALRPNCRPALSSFTAPTTRRATPTATTNTATAR